MRTTKTTGILTRNNFPKNLHFWLKNILISAKMIKKSREMIQNDTYLIIYPIDNPNNDPMFEKTMLIFSMVLIFCSDGVKYWIIWEIIPINRFHTILFRFISINWPWN